MALSETRRQQLDDIVQDMIKNKESDANIQFVVDDFKKKYEGEQLKPLVSKSIEQPKEIITKKVGIGEKIAKFLSPKSVEGLGATIGGALATKSKDVIEAQKAQEQLDDMNVKLGEAIITGKQQGKDTTRLERIYQENTGRVFNLSEIIPETEKTTKQIAGEAVGTLGTIALGAKPSASVAGRLGMAATFGAGAGLKSGLEKEMTAPEIAKKTAVGAGVGLATGLVFEGIGKLLRSAGSKLGKNVYNKELQPDTKQLTSEIKRNAQTFGEQVRNVVDDKGKPVYVGNYKTLLSKSQNEVKNNGQKLEKLLVNLDKTNPIKISRNEATKGLVSSLQDEFGSLTKQQIETIKMEVKRLPQEMNRQDMLKAKRMVDDLISNADWDKILTDGQASYANQVKYIIRDNLRKLIEGSADDTVVKELNQRMSMGMEVRDLVAKQLAIRAKQKISATGGVFYKLFGKLVDDYILNPSITTRFSQAMKTAGSKTGQTVARQAARLGITKKLAE